MPTVLTEASIARAFDEAVTAGARRDLSDSREPGLRLRLTPPSTRNRSGMKAWVLCCRDRLGAMRRFPVGAYPELGLADARRAARALRLKVREEGADPIADRRRDRAIGKAARGGEGTLKAMLDLFEGQAGDVPKSWPGGRKTVERIFAPLLGRPVAMLTARDLQAEADGYAAKQTASFAVRTLRPVLKWLAYRGHVPAGLVEIRQPTPAQSRDRVLSRAELAKVLPALRASTTTHALMMRFLLLTAARRSEAGDATWGDVDLEGATWVIPTTKNNLPHTVPLSRQALALLVDAKPKGAKADARIFGTASGKALGNWDRETKLLHKAGGVGGWHRHDLRRTAATLTAELGVLPDLIEAMLNHVAIRSPLAATYNKSRYRPQVADALQRLADDLDAIEAQTRKLAGEEKAPVCSPMETALSDTV